MTSKDKSQNTGRSGSYNQYSADAFKFFQNFKSSHYDVDSLLQNHRKNLETLEQAQQAAIESARTLAQLQGQFIRQTMEDTASLMRHFMTPEIHVNEKLEAHTQSLKEGVQKAASHGEEVTEILSKTQKKVIKLASHRLNECIDEIMKATKTATKNS